MPALDQKTIIFFIAGHVPTAAEAALIARIRGTVLVRSVLKDVAYGSGLLESADGLAGSIPTSYKTAAGPSIDLNDYPMGDVTPTLTAKPEAFNVFPATLALASGSAQLRAIGAELNEATGAIELSDKTGVSEIAWTSSDTGKATVSGGVVTKVAAGSTTITATLTYAPTKTVTATCVVTVS